MADTEAQEWLKEVRARGLLGKGPGTDPQITAIANKLIAKGLIPGMQSSAARLPGLAAEAGMTLSPGKTPAGKQGMVASKPKPPPPAKKPYSVATDASINYPRMGASWSPEEMKLITRSPAQHAATLGANAGGITGEAEVDKILGDVLASDPTLRALLQVTGMDQATGLTVAGALAGPAIGTAFKGLNKAAQAGSKAAKLGKMAIAGVGGAFAVPLASQAAKDIAEGNKGAGIVRAVGTAATLLGSGLALSGIRTKRTPRVMTSGNFMPDGQPILPGPEVEQVKPGKTSKRFLRQDSDAAVEAPAPPAPPLQTTDRWVRPPGPGKALATGKSIAEPVEVPAAMTAARLGPGQKALPKPPETPKAPIITPAKRGTFTPHDDPLLGHLVSVKDENKHLGRLTVAGLRREYGIDRARAENLLDLHKYTQKQRVADVVKNIPKGTSLRGPEDTAQVTHEELSNLLDMKADDFLKPSKRFPGEMVQDEYDMDELVKYGIVSPEVKAQVEHVNSIQNANAVKEGKAVDLSKPRFTARAGDVADDIVTEVKAGRASLPPEGMTLAQKAEWNRQRVAKSQASSSAEPSTQSIIDIRAEVEASDLADEIQRMTAALSHADRTNPKSLAMAESVARSNVAKRWGASEAEVDLNARPGQTSVRRLRPANLKRANVVKTKPGVAIISEAKSGEVDVSFIPRPASYKPPQPPPPPKPQTPKAPTIPSRRPVAVTPEENAHVAAERLAHRAAQRQVGTPPSSFDEQAVRNEYRAQVQRKAVVDTAVDAAVTKATAKAPARRRMGKQTGAVNLPTVDDLKDLGQRVGTFTKSILKDLEAAGAGASGLSHKLASLAGDDAKAQAAASWLNSNTHRGVEEALDMSNRMLSGLKNSVVNNLGISKTVTLAGKPRTWKTAPAGGWKKAIADAATKATSKKLTDAEKTAWNAHLSTPSGTTFAGLQPYARARNISTPELKVLTDYAKANSELVKAAGLSVKRVLKASGIQGFGEQVSLEIKGRQMTGTFTGKNPDGTFNFAPDGWKQGDPLEIVKAGQKYKSASRVHPAEFFPQVLLREKGDALRLEVARMVNGGLTVDQSPTIKALMLHLGSAGTAQFKTDKKALKFITDTFDPKSMSAASNLLSQADSRIEMERSGIAFPADWYDQNLIGNLDDHFTRSATTIAMMKRFGDNEELANRAIQMMTGSRGDQSDIVAEFRHAIGAGQSPSKGMIAASKFSSLEAAYTVLTKLTGFTTTIGQLPQVAMTAAEFGTVNAAKAALLMAKANSPTRWAAERKVLDRVLASGATNQDVLGVFGADEASAAVRQAAEKALKLTGVTPMDRLGRRHAAVAAEMYLNGVTGHMAKNPELPAKNEREFLKEFFHFTDANIDDMVARKLQGGDLTQEEILAAYHAGAKTQVSTKPIDQSRWMANPYLRPLLRLKTYSMGQTVLFNHLLRRARRGDVKPLITALVGFGVASEIVEPGRRKIRGAISGTEPERNAPSWTEVLGGLKEGKISPVLWKMLDSAVVSGVAGLWNIPGKAVLEAHGASTGRQAGSDAAQSILRDVVPPVFSTLVQKPVEAAGESADPKHGGILERGVRALGIFAGKEAALVRGGQQKLNKGSSKDAISEMVGKDLAAYKQAMIKRGTPATFEQMSSERRALASRYNALYKDVGNEQVRKDLALSRRQAR